MSWLTPKQKLNVHVSCVTATFWYILWLVCYGLTQYPVIADKIELLGTVKATNNTILQLNPVSNRSL
jgi:Na+/melibiose symporter-like transporter